MEKKWYDTSGEDGFLSGYHRFIYRVYWWIRYRSVGFLVWTFLHLAVMAMGLWVWYGVWLLAKAIWRAIT